MMTRYRCIWLLLEPCPPQDAVFGTRRQVIVRLAHYGDATRLGVVLELTVATLLRNLIPAVILYQFDYLTNLHGLPWSTDPAAATRYASQHAPAFSGQSRGRREMQTRNPANRRGKGRDVTQPYAA